MVGTQAIATLIAVYGLLMTPLGWGVAAFVWGYAIIWALDGEPDWTVAGRFTGCAQITFLTTDGCRQSPHRPQQLLASPAY